MAIATDIRSAGQSGLVQTLHSAWAEMAERRAKRRAFRTSLAEMQALSNRELADLGLSRSMLKGIAYEAVYGTKG